MKDWVVPAAGLVALQLIFAFLMGWLHGYVVPPPLGRYLELFAALGITFGGPVALWLLVRMVAKPMLSASIRDMKVPNLLPMVVGIGILFFQMVALTWLKPVLPMVSGFWADPYLADLDALLFGRDPWRLTHVIGPANRLIDYSYNLWFPVVFAVLGLSCLTNNARVILTFFIAIGVCAVLQFLLPSAGPIFYERTGNGARFAELAPQVPRWVQSTSEYLWRYHVAGRQGLGTGISAMPSVHVALAAWVGLAAFVLNRPWFVPACAWFALILFGSVYTGWHYAIDGIASIGVLIVAWKGAGVFRRRPVVTQRRFWKSRQVMSP